MATVELPKCEKCGKHHWCRICENCGPPVNDGIGEYVRPYHKADFTAEQRIRDLEGLVNSIDDRLDQYVGRLKRATEPKVDAMPEMWGMTNPPKPLNDAAKAHVGRLREYVNADFTPAPDIYPKPQRRCPKCGQRHVIEVRDGHRYKAAAVVVLDSLRIGSDESLRQKCRHCQLSWFCRPLDYRKPRAWGDEPPRWALFINELRAAAQAIAVFKLTEWGGRWMGWW